MLEVYDTRQEFQAFSQWSLVHTTTHGYCEADSVNTLDEIYTQALSLWLTKTSITTSKNDLRDYLREVLSAIPEVDRVTISEREKSDHRTIELWIELSKSTQDVRYRVYEVEQHIMDRFHECFFDFHVFGTRSHLPAGAEEVIPPRKA